MSPVLRVKRFRVSRPDRWLTVMLFAALLVPQVAVGQATPAHTYMVNGIALKPLPRFSELSPGNRLTRLSTFGLCVITIFGPKY